MDLIDKYNKKNNDTKYIDLCNKMDNLQNSLIKIQNLNINKQFDFINEAFDKINNRIQSLEKNVDNLKMYINNLDKEKEPNKCEEDLIELKKEHIQIDNELIKKALYYKDYRSVLMIFKHYYKKKENITHKYPIRIKSKRIYEYFLNNKWIADNNGHYIKHTLFMNIETLFLQFNHIENIEDYDTIYQNQIFINKLTTDKSKRDIFKHIVDEIKNVV